MNQEQFLESAREKTKEFWHSFLTGSNYEFNTLLKDSTIMTVKCSSNFCGSRMPLERQMIQLQEKLFSGSRKKLSEEWFEAQPVSEEVCVVYGGLQTDICVLFSMVCRKDEEKIYFCHMHHSLSLPGRPSETLSCVLLFREKAMLERYRSLQIKSSRDMLTGVYNRGYMEELINQSLESCRQKCAFIMVDMDDFKAVNDTWGHVFGDRLLVKFAQFLRESFIAGGEVGRIGGDEFCVFINNVISEDMVERWLKSFFDMLKLEVSEENQVQLQCSAGVCFSNEKINTFMDLYAKADQAMYWAKKNKTGSYKVYREKDME